MTKNDDFRLFARSSIDDSIYGESRWLMLHHMAMADHYGFGVSDFLILHKGDTHVVIQLLLSENQIYWSKLKLKICS
jgi:hypothetical protein